MAERDLTTRFGADTSGFSKGVSEVVAQLDKYNKALADNQQQVRKVNREISDLEKQQNKLKKQMEDGGTEEQKKQYAELTEKIEQYRVTLAQLRTDQTRIKSAISETSSELKKEGQEVEKTSDGFTIMKGAISNLVSDALNVAIDKFKEMSVSADKSLNSLQVKTGMSAKAVGELKDEMYDIYKNNFGDSLTDVADKIALVTQNIDESDPSKIKSITENAIGLSDAFGSDFEENLRGVNGLMTNMGLTADEAFDLIAKGSQNGLDKTHELTDNLAEYTQIWGQAGFSAQEMFSILQNGLDSGAYNLDKVNDLVGEMSRSIIDGRLAENIDSFSDKTEQIFESFKSGKATQREVFDSVIDDLNNTSNLAEKLATSSNTWSSLGEDNSMKVIEALNKVNDTYKNVEGTMQKINDIQYDDVGSQISALGRQFEVDILQPVVEDATPKIEAAITWISNNLPSVTANLTGLVTTVVAFKTATAAGKFLESLILGFKQLNPAIKAATAEQATNNAVTAANPYVAVASAILGAVAATEVWVNTNYKVVDGIKDVNELTKQLEENATQQRSTVETEIEQIESLNSVYDELRTKSELTVEEKDTLAQVSEELASKLGIEESAIEGVDGKYKDLTGSIDEYIKKAHQRVELSIIESNWETTAKELENTKRELEQKLEEKGYSKDEVLDAAGAGIVNHYKEKTDLLEEKIKEYKNQYDSILQGTQEPTKMMTANTALSVKNSNEPIENSTKAISENTNAKAENSDETEKSIVANEEFTKAISEMSAKTTAVTKAEEEYNETKKLSASTLQAVINKYPELEGEVYKYMLGLEDAKTLIKSMKSTYNNDLEAYKNVIIEKAYSSNDFYNQLINANSDFVNDAKKKYDIDLLNFANLQEAKKAIVSAEKKKLDSGWGTVSTFDERVGILGNLTKFNQITSQYGDVNTYLATQIADDYINSFIPISTDKINKDLFSTNGNGSGGSSDKDKNNAEDGLLKRYELAEAAYNRLVDKRIEKIKQEQEAKEKAKNAAIAAIDAEIEARKRLNEDRDLQKELNEVNAQLQYAHLDGLSRRELERKRQDILNEQVEIWWQRQMSDKKDKIESDYSRQSQSYDKAIESLQQAAESAKNYFSKLAGTQTSTQIVNNNSDTRNIQIIANALSNQQILDKLLNAIYSK